MKLPDKHNWLWGSEFYFKILKKKWLRFTMKSFCIHICHVWSIRWVFFCFFWKGVSRQRDWINRGAGGNKFVVNKIFSNFLFEICLSSVSSVLTKYHTKNLLPNNVSSWNLSSRPYSWKCVMQLWHQLSSVSLTKHTLLKRLQHLNSAELCQKTKVCGYRFDQQSGGV